jgi:hypothetical protein
VAEDGQLGLDSDGLLPPGVHPATPTDVERLLVYGLDNSEQRRKVFDDWMRHRATLLDLVSFRHQWLDGSFVTDKPKPGDADVVTIIDSLIFDGLTDARQTLVRKMHQGPTSKELWGVDAYLLVRYPEGHADHDTWVRGEAEWTWQWSRVRGRPDRWKGFLEVSA